MYIDDLTKFGYLRVLDLSENMIYDLSPIEKLTALRKLNLDTNNISDISHLSELTELLERAADAVIERGWEMPQELGSYLKGDIPDFVTELRMAAQNHCVPKIVVV